MPKAIADQYGIKPGDELEWVPAGDSIRVELVRRKAKAGQQLTTEERLALFDAGMKRVDELQAEELKKNAGQADHPRRRVAGRARISTTMIGDSRVASLVDTNILVYCYDFDALQPSGRRRETSCAKEPRRTILEFHIRP